MSGFLGKDGVSQQIGCVIIAAGLSKRMGREKSLLEIGSRTMTKWFTDRMIAHDFNPIVVTRKDLEQKISEQVSRHRIAINPIPESGRTGSIQVGISKLDRLSVTPYRLLVVPIDRPGFSDSTLSKLIVSLETCCPEKDGYGGHPILLSVEDVEIVRGASPETPLRDLVKPNRLKVDDPFLHLNIDSKENLVGLSEILLGIWN